jgi:hypothetical protein
MDSLRWRTKISNLPEDPAAVAAATDTTVTLPITGLEGSERGPRPDM